jgi:hypothetical protein
MEPVAMTLVQVVDVVVVLDRFVPASLAMLVVVIAVMVVIDLLDLSGFERFRILGHAERHLRHREPLSLCLPFRCVLAP